MPSLSEQVSARTIAARESARREWAALAHAAAAGDDTADLSVVEDLARSLGVPANAAVRAFQGDVEALQRYPVETATSENMLDSVAAKLEEFGDDVGLSAAIADTDARLRELRAVENQIHFLRRAGFEAATRARFLSQQHPRVFPETN